MIFSSSINPVSCRTISPFSKNIKVGTDIMLYLLANSGNLSISTFKIFKFSPNFSSIYSRTGESILQGPHHEAKKSTIIGEIEFVISLSKFCESKTVII